MPIVRVCVRVCVRMRVCEPTCGSEAITRILCSRAVGRNDTVENQKKKKTMNLFTIEIASEDNIIILYIITQYKGETNYAMNI